MTDATTFRAMNANVLSALRLVLSHYYHDEEKDFETSGSDAAKHIFASLKFLNDWLMEFERANRGAELLPAPFDDYEIHPCRRFQEPDDPQRFYFEVCEPHEADVWTLYGHIPSQGVDAIGDFSSREFAEEIYARITGRSYGRIA